MHWNSSEGKLSAQIFFFMQAPGLWVSQSLMICSQLICGISVSMLQSCSYGYSPSNIPWALLLSECMSLSVLFICFQSRNSDCKPDSAFSWWVKKKKKIRWLQLWHFKSFSTFVRMHEYEKGIFLRILIWSCSLLLQASFSCCLVLWSYFLTKTKKKVGKVSVARKQQFYSFLHSSYIHRDKDIVTETTRALHMLTQFNFVLPNIWL